MKHMCIYCRETGETKYVESHPFETDEEIAFVRIRAESLYLQAVMDSTKTETWVAYCQDEPFKKEMIE